MRISDWSSDVCSSDLVNRRKKDMSSDLADLLGRLLQPDPNVRLKESSELQQHPWIADELHLSPPTMDRSIISHVPESTEAPVPLAALKHIQLVYRPPSLSAPTFRRPSYPTATSTDLTYPRLRSQPPTNLTLS